MDGIAVAEQLARVAIHDEFTESSSHSCARKSFGQSPDAPQDFGVRGGHITPDHGGEARTPGFLTPGNRQGNGGRP